MKTSDEKYRRMKTFDIRRSNERALKITRKAIVRRGVMAQLASVTWGLEVGVLRSTHLALITGLIQYGCNVW